VNDKVESRLVADGQMWRDGLGPPPPLHPNPTPTPKRWRTLYAVASASIVVAGIAALAVALASGRTDTTSGASHSPSPSSATTPGISTSSSSVGATAPSVSSSAGATAAPTPGTSSHAGPNACLDADFSVSSPQVRSFSNGEDLRVQLMYTGKPACTISAYGPFVTLIDLHGNTRASAEGTAFVKLVPDVVRIRPNQAVIIHVTWGQRCTSPAADITRANMRLSGSSHQAGAPVAVTIPGATPGCTSDSQFPDVAILNIDPPVTS
jgi:hypothetical protein